MTNTCKDCKYWNRVDPVLGQMEKAQFTRLDETAVEFSMGTCRRHSPTGRYKWPATLEVDWCGEFEFLNPVGVDALVANKALNALKESIQSRVALFDELSDQHKSKKDLTGASHYKLCAAIFSDISSAILHTINNLERGESESVGLKQFDSPPANT